MGKSLYAYSDYKKYLQDRIHSEPNEGHGFRRKIADAIGCQLSYISLVLNGDRDLSVEQAEALSRFLGMDVDEREFFIWLLQFQRAGSQGAREFFSGLLNKKRDQYLQSQVKVESEAMLSEAAKAIFFGNYLYAAIQSLVMIDGFQSISALSKTLEIELSRAAEIVSFLKRHGLILEDRGKLKPANKTLFIDRDSPFILQHHSNWRMQALHSVSRARKSDQHLSFLFTVSDRDAEKIRQRIAELVGEITDIALPSKEETVMVANFDFFALL